MEGTHGKLCTRLSDGLRSDNTDCLTNLYRLTGSHVGAVALRTDTDTGFAGQNGTDFHLRNRGASVLIHAVADNLFRSPWGNHMVRFYQHIAVFIADIIAGISSGNPVLKTFNLFISVGKGMDIHSRNLVFLFRTVHFPDNQFLGNVYQTSGQVTGVRGTQSRIGKTFPGSMGGHKVFQYVQTFTEVGTDRQLDGTSGGIGHQTTHSGKLFNLLVGTTGAGIRHHEDVVVFVQTGKQGVRQLVVRVFPGLDNFFIPLFFCDKTTFEVLCDSIHRILGLRNHLRLLGRHGHVGNGHGHGRTGGEFVTNGFYAVQHFCRGGRAVGIDYFFQNLL